MSTLDRLPDAVASNKEYDEFLAHRLKMTRKYVRTNDLLLASVTGVTCILGYFFLFVLVDHWIFPGGLGPLWRTALLLGVVGAIATWTFRRLSRPLNQKVTALFAASRLEQAAPEMKSSLLTLVDLQTHKRQTSSEIAYALKRRACKELADVDLKAELESRELILFSYALVVLIALMLMYAFFSPKSLFLSAYRAANPLTSVEAPTRTRITDVAPGDVDVVSGSQLEVIVHLEGKLPEQVVLEYSTADEQILNEPVTMTLVDELLNKYTGLITGPNGTGIRQPMTYHVIAGDDQSADYDIRTRQLPLAAVEKIKITPPAYMKLPSSEQSSGHLDIWEGSIVRLSTTVEPAAQSAIVKFSDTDQHTQTAEEIPLKGSGNQFSGTWPPMMLRTDGTYPRFYHIEAVDVSGESHPYPALYGLSLRIDKRPDVTLLAPQGELSLPVNDVIDFKFLARDPDFQLASVWLNVSKNQQVIHREPLWEGEQQSLSLTHAFALSDLLLKPGEQLQMWIEVNDNREPQPNRRLSEKVIVNLMAAETSDQLKQRQEQRKEEQQKQNEQEDSKQDPATENDPSGETGEDNATEQPGMTESENEDSNSEPGSTQNSQQKQGDAEESQQQGAQQPSDGTKGTESSEQANELTEKSGENGSADSENSEGEQGTAEENSLRNNGEDDDLALEEIVRNYQNKNPQPEPNRSPEEQQNPQTGKQEETNPGENSSAKNSEEQTMSPETSEQNPQQQTSPENPDPNQSDPQGEPGNKPQDSNSTSPENNTGETDPMGANDDPGSMTKSEENPENSSAKPDNQSEGTKSAEQPSEANPQQQQGNPDQQGKPEESSTNPDGKPASEGEMQDPQSQQAKPAEQQDPNAKQSQSPQQTDPNSKPTTQKQQQPQQPDPNQPSKPGSPSENSQQNGKPQNSSSDSSSQQSAEGKSTDGKSGESSSDSQSGKSSQGSPSGDSKSGDSKPSGSESSDSKSGGEQSSQDSAMNNNEQNSSQSPESQNSEKPSESSSSQSMGNEKGSDASGSPENQSGNPQSAESEKNSEQQSPQQNPDGQPPKQQNDQQSPQGQNSNGKQGGKQSSGGASSEGNSKSGASSSDPGNKPGTGSPQGQSSPSQPNPNADGGNAVGGDNGPDSQPGQGTGTGTGEGTPGKPTENTLADKKKAADLALKQLEEDIRRGDVDEELLEQLGWNEKDLNKFLDRLNRQRLNRDPVTQEEVNRQKQYEELLKGMKLDRTNSNRTGGTQDQFDVNSFAPNRQTAPLEYREWEAAFRKRLLEQVSE